MKHSTKLDDEKQQYNIKNPEKKILTNISAKEYFLKEASLWRSEDDICYLFLDQENNKIPKFKLVLSFNDELTFEVFVINTENYNDKLIISGSISRDGCSSSTDETCISVKEVNARLEIFARRIDPDIKSTFEILFNMKNIEEINDITELKLRLKAQKIFTLVSLSVNNNIKNKLNSLKTKQLSVDVAFQTDAFGLNLGEITALVTADKCYPGGYPTKLLGYCDNINVDLHVDGLIITPYSFRPDLQKVLKEKGSTLLSQTNRINKKYGGELSDCEFYNNICTYSSLKYVFAGLSSGVFSDKWLYGKNNKKFYKSMKNSDFSDFLKLFIDPQYGLIEFNIFFRYDKIKK